MLLTALSSPAFAQDGSTDPCGSLCDLVDTLLYGTPLVTGALGALVALLLHAMVSASAARKWTGGGVGTLVLWLWPLVGAFVPPVLGVVALVALAVTNSSFRTLLMLDAQSLPSALVWALGGLLLPLVPFAIARLRLR